MEYKFTSANFESEVLSSEIPVLVDFYADWCGPCKMMAPIVEQLAGKYDGKVKIGKCNNKFRIKLNKPSAIIPSRGGLPPLFIHSR